MRIGRTGRPSRSIYISLPGGSPPLTILWSHAPKIIFLLAMMIGERNRHLRLTGAAGYMSRVRLSVISSAYSGYGAWKSQRGRRGRELLTLIPRRIAVANPIADILN